ncbi:hypothetical protein [Hominifimenecus sp. rT4P-3]|uniref:hypothetical protein n=1 Tax=Hominifimenecus sp. rT4P-3 TaxID=3242979 RepID=UPI003DA48725
MAEAGVDNITFLEEAKAAVIQLRRAQAVKDEQELQTKRLEKALTLEKKAVADSIELTIRKRKAEITDSYDTQIEEIQGHLKKIRNKREKAKNEGMKDRIAEETADLREENRRLNTEIKTGFRQDRVPGFCNSLLFYSLYYTRGLKEILVFILTFAVCFFCVPVGIYRLTGVDSTLVLILLYVVDIFFFGGLYFLLNNQIKVRHLDALRKGRENRNAMAANRRKIKAIKNAIRKDKNEEMYGLEKFDREIEKLEEEKIGVANQKQEALTHFENTGKVLIAQEITENNHDRISKLDADFTHSSELLAEYRERLRKATMILTERYEPMLGREFLQEEKLDALLAAISSGQAANITEAQELVRAGAPIGVAEPPVDSDSEQGEKRESSDAT